MCYYRGAGNAAPAGVARASAYSQIARMTLSHDFYYIWMMFWCPAGTVVNSVTGVTSSEREVTSFDSGNYIFLADWSLSFLLWFNTTTAVWVSDYDLSVPATETGNITFGSAPHSPVLSFVLLSYVQPVNWGGFTKGVVSGVKGKGHVRWILTIKLGVLQCYQWDWSLWRCSWRPRIHIYLQSHGLVVHPTSYWKLVGQTPHLPLVWIIFMCTALNAHVFLFFVISLSCK